MDIISNSVIASTQMREKVKEFFKSHISQLMWRCLRETGDTKDVNQWQISCRVPRHEWRRLIKAYITFAYVHNLNDSIWIQAGGQ